MTKLPSPFDIPDDAPRDPGAAARQSMKTPVMKRFWTSATMVETADGFALTLDGKPARTPGRKPLTAPTRRAADALAAEWSEVGEAIDPGRMPVTRLVNSAIDGVAERAEAVRADVVAYAGSDLLCYRAAEPERLAARQIELWDPVLRWARDALGARFSLAEGVMHVVQPPEAAAAIAQAVAAVQGPHALAALHSVTTLTGSAVLALALHRGRLDADAVWAAAHLDEDVQMEIWGRDEEALARRALRRAEFDAAALLLSA